MRRTIRSAPSGDVDSLLGGRYRLGLRLGVGGMATIYRAWDVELERDVAVKVIHAHLLDDDEIVEHFRREARHAAALVHPHIVTVFDQGVDDLPYIVMELVDGPSLRQVLHEHGRLSPPQALAVLLPVCAALARAHAAGVVHRDIKPENVLLAPDGSPKVADFGIAYTGATTSRTATGT
jgi:eukaryotic-like serine/threonine-protein kinase